MRIGILLFVLSLAVGALAARPIDDTGTPDTFGCYKTVLPAGTAGTSQIVKFGADGNGQYVLGKVTFDAANEVVSANRADALGGGPSVDVYQFFTSGGAFFFCPDYPNFASPGYF